MTIFGDPFALTSEFAQQQIENNDLTFLDARYNVVFETDEFKITCVQLLYDKTLDQLRAFGDETQRCIVQQVGGLTFCDEFIFRPSTGLGEFVGAPNVTYRESRKQDLEMEGDHIAFRQHDATGTQLDITRDPLVGADFQAPGSNSLKNELVKNSTILLAPATPKPRPKIASDIPDDALTTRPLRTVVRIAPANLSQLTDASEIDPKDIEATPPLGKIDDDSSKDD